MDKIYYIKIKNFCSSDPWQGVEKHISDWEDTFTTHTTGEWLISTIYKEHLWMDFFNGQKTRKGISRELHVLQTYEN